MARRAPKMNFSMLVGILAGCGLIMFGIGIGNLYAFISIKGAAIVIGGTFAALVASFPYNALKQVPTQIWIAFRGTLLNPGVFINQIVDCAHVARKFGLLRLEQLAEAQDDYFLRDSLLLVVDAVDAGKARSMLESDMIYLDERHNGAIAFFDRGAAFAPAFGMLGTLIGLIIMLANLSLDVDNGTETLTAGMSIALVTTFYGSILANLFFLPVSSKLKAMNDREMLCKRIIVEGVMSIQAGENPKFIREKLISFLPRKEREELLQSLAKEANRNKDVQETKDAG